MKTNEQILTVIDRVTSGQINKESAKVILQTIFDLSQEESELIVDSLTVTDLPNTTVIPEGNK